MAMATPRTPPLHRNDSKFLSGPPSWSFEAPPPPVSSPKSALETRRAAMKQSRSGLALSLQKRFGWHLDNNESTQRPIITDEYPHTQTMTRHLSRRPKSAGGSSGERERAHQQLMQQMTRALSPTQDHLDEGEGHEGQQQQAVTTTQQPQDQQVSDDGLAQPTTTTASPPSKRPSSSSAATSPSKRPPLPPPPPRLYKQTSHTTASARATIGGVRPQSSSKRHWLAERVRENLWALPPPRLPSDMPPRAPYNEGEAFPRAPRVEMDEVFLGLPPPPPPDGHVPEDVIKIDHKEGWLSLPEKRRLQKLQEAEGLVAPRTSGTTATNSSSRRTNGSSREQGREQGRQQAATSKLVCTGMRKRPGSRRGRDEPSTSTDIGPPPLPHQARLKAHVRNKTFKPPWDDSPPDPLLIAREEEVGDDEESLQGPPHVPIEVAKKTTWGSLKEQMARVRSNLESRTRRLKKTLTVVDDAHNHAKQRTSEVKDAHLEEAKLEEMGDAVTFEERRLIDSIDKLATAAYDAAKEMEEHYILLEGFQEQVDAKVEEFGEYHSVIDSMLTNPPSPEKGGLQRRGMFKVQQFMLGASAVETDARIACQQAMEAARRHGTAVERAKGEQNRWLHKVLAAPRRKVPYVRAFTEEVGLERVLDKLLGMERVEKGRSQTRHIVPYYVLKKRYPTDDDVPDVHHSKIEQNDYSYDDLLTGPAQRRVSMQFAAAAARTIGDEDSDKNKEEKEDSSKTKGGARSVEIEPLPDGPSLDIREAARSTDNARTRRLRKKDLERGLPWPMPGMDVFEAGVQVFEASTLPSTDRTVDGVKKGEVVQQL